MPTKALHLTLSLQYGLIGSTEWAEDFVDWIDEHVVAYLNLGMYTSQYHCSSAKKSSPIDSSVSGSRFVAFGSPLLAHMIRDIAEELPHPTDKGRTLWDATNDDGKLFGLMGHANVTTKEEVKPIRAMEFAKADNTGVYLLGSGSDFTVFLQRNGVGPMTKI